MFKKMKKLFGGPQVPPRLKPGFPVFKTVTTGRYERLSDLLGAMRDAGISLALQVEDILAKIPLLPLEAELDIVIISGADLGFSRAAPRQDIYSRGLELGLALCPAEAGPALRLARPPEPRGIGPLILIAMEPLRQEWFSGGRVVESEMRIFGIDADRSLLPISAYNPCNPGGVFMPDNLWAFVQPRN